ncbi:unnamed protein product [Adineta steineri]|uniref:Uncharacterized protein n=1 Tax=Adineta steineri TaxID=433720 RepID=A0A819EWT6_9BILA|nr:unnamed protein product [Adineta steineri]CAF3856314.1 unnamed protein product [Adineta steineri]
MVELEKSMELETRRHSTTVPQTLQTIRQGGPMIESSGKLESSKTSGPITVNMRVSRQIQSNKALFNVNPSNMIDENPIP